MSTTKKHWSEVGRVKNSDWFHNLPALEQAAILEALEHDTHESAVKLRAALAFTYATVIYTVAGTFWGAFLHYHILWFGVAGAVIGALLGSLSANVIAIQKTPEDAGAMQAIFGKFVGLPGIVIAVTGLVAWAVW